MTYPVFPTLAGQAIGIQRFPIWQSSISTSLSGKETPISYMSYPNYQWVVDFNALRSYNGYAEMAQMIGFFNSVSGMAGRFLFQDPEDNAVTAQQFGTGNASTVAFQLVRTYGGYVEPVQFPGNQNTNPYPGIAVYINGTLSPYGSGWTWSSTVLGGVVFATAPASGAVLTWSGTFGYLCRMMQDTQEFDQEFVNAWSTKSLAFKSVKL